MYPAQYRHTTALMLRLLAIVLAGMSVITKAQPQPGTSNATGGAFMASGAEALAKLGNDVSALAM